MDISQELITKFLTTLDLDVLNSLVGTVTQYLIKEEFDHKQDLSRAISRKLSNISKMPIFFQRNQNLSSSYRIQAPRKSQSPQFIDKIHEIKHIHLKSNHHYNTVNTADEKNIVFEIYMGIMIKNFGKDAIKIILRHSPNVKSILRRKIIRREVLFTYLSERNIPLHPPHTKENLIDAALDYWNNESKDKQNSNKSDHDENSKINNETKLVTNISKSENTVQKDETNINEMAVTFSEWFYKMFNESKPIDVEHFWEDCNLKLNFKSGETSYSDTVENSAENTVQLLYKTKITHRMFLNPNLLPEGCQGRMDTHGVVLVLTCGTIHVNNLCVGVFEQVFALVRDPLVCNNWKIKYTELNLRSQANTNSIPQLTDNELTSNLLCLEH